MTTPAHPLDGVRVLEMGAWGPASIAGQWLGDLGADVIIVDPPANRAITDQWGRAGGRTVTGRNKRSIVVNLKTEEGRAVVRDLVRRTDVLIEANRPGVMKKLGAGYDDLCVVKPDLIYCSVTGFGQEGPYRSYPGHGLSWEGVGGWLRAHGMEYGNMGGDYTGAPWLNPVNLADLRTTLHAVIAIQSALLVRARTGEGQHLDLAMLDAVTAVRSPRVPPRGDGVYEEPRGPWWAAYRCADDRWVAIAAIETLQWANLCRGIGREDLIEARAANRRAEITAALAATFLTKTRDEWFALLRDADTELTPALTLDESAADPQVRLRGMHVPVVGRDGTTDVQYGTPVKLSKTPPRAVHRGAPKIGEDTDEILGGLGYDAARVAALRASDAVR